MGRVFVLSAALLCLTVGIDAQQRVQASNILEHLQVIGPSTQYGLPAAFHVRGETPFELQVLAAETIVFHPNSRLILGGEFGDRAARYIVARTVRVLPGGDTPPTVTWPRNQVVPSAPWLLPKAPSGDTGASEGAHGSQGSDGGPGNTGIPGRSAPTLFILTTAIEGRLQVDLKGQDGGPGGVGQEGGTGGLGRTGRRGVAGIIDCRSGPTRGGDGGRGGNGGRGGQGGRGGNGGNLFILSREPLLDQLAKTIDFSLAPGSPGPGGRGGDPGEGAAGGGSVSGIGLCEGAASGNQGAKGEPGSDGPPGSDGSAGSVGVVPMTDQQLRMLGVVK